MKKLIKKAVGCKLLALMLIAYSLPLNATDYYVAKTGSNTSPFDTWAKACTTFANIPWASVGAGDNVYIDGGADSVVWQETLYPDCRGTAANWVTITTGMYSPSPSGHSGKVIIDGINQTLEGIVLSNGGGGKPSYLKIKGFTIQNVTYGMYANFDEAHDCLMFDSLTVLNHGERAFEMVCLIAHNVDSIFIQNCRMVSDTYYAGESDGIYFSGTQHNFIDNNYIRVPNQQPLAHVDALQGYLTGGWVITNNIFINDSVYSTEGGGIPIILGSQGNNPVIIYNNFLYMGGVWYPTGSWASVMLTRWYDVTPMPPTYIIHNTSVGNGRYVRNFDIEYSTGVKTVILNNIIAQYSTNGGDELESFNANNGDVLYVDSIRHNLFYRDWENDADITGSASYVGSGGSPTGTPGNWATWTGTYGGTGVLGDPDLIDNIGYEPDQGTLSPEIGGSSAGINQGEDLEDYINYLNTIYGLNGRLVWEDIYGTPRDATPDIGAFEYQQGGSQFKIMGVTAAKVQGIAPSKVWGIQ